MSYWRVPLEVLEDPTELGLWAQGAIRAAVAGRSKPRRAKKKKEESRRVTPPRR
jgi:TfoX/Sxy family transcriptional regulator of competence genes